MTGNEPDKADDSEDGDEDWMAYANAGFGETNYSLWDDVEETTEAPEQNVDANGEMEAVDQLGTHMEEIPRAPSPAGHKHLVRIGTCDACLGRVGGKRHYGQLLEEAGSDVRQLVLDRDAHLSTAREHEPLCPFCENLFEEVDLLADIIHDAIQPYEVGRLQLGARFPKDQTEGEEELRKRFGAGGSDPLKSSLVNGIARNLSDRLDGVNMVSEKPDVLALIDVLTLTVDLDIRAVYVYGRYRKLERGIPQTRWPCRACKGRGCERCGQTGLQYERSVQDLIGDPMLNALNGKDHAFHGMGREDIDVRCMGRGRPFVMEIKEPIKRAFSAAKLTEIINKHAGGSVEVSSLRPSTRKEVVRIKDTPAEKSYTIRFTLEPMNESELAVLTAPVDLTDGGGKGRNKKRRRQRRGDKGSDRTKPLEAPIETPPTRPADEVLVKMKKAELVALCTEHSLPTSGTKPVLIERLQEALPPAPETFDLPTDERIIEVIEGLKGVKLAQRTPERVSHRRADLIRKRTVFESHTPSIEVNEDGQREIEFTLRCESGTYVKETVHGDSGRTQPSVASLIRAKCNVVWLDVGDIHAD